MRVLNDPLFTIFEQNLYQSLVEDETTDEFVDRVIYEYIQTLIATKRVPPDNADALEEGLREEILEMLRKKTYGYMNLRDYRRAHPHSRRRTSEA